MVQSVSRNPAQDARATISAHWAKDGKYRLPVDPFVIAERLGIKVHYDNLDPGTAGQLVKRAGQDPEIYLNWSDSPGRQRFTCAHEIGHYTIHAKSDTDEWEYIDRRDAASSTGTRSQEIYANQFAAALLMPAAAVRKHRADLTRLQLAAKFDVSLEAMNYRLANLAQ